MEAFREFMRGDIITNPLSLYTRQDRERNKDMLIVGFSANASDEDLEQGFLAGNMHYHCPYPFHHYRLLPLPLLPLPLLPLPLLPLPLPFPPLSPLTNSPITISPFYPFFNPSSNPSSTPLLLLFYSHNNTTSHLITSHHIGMHFFCQKPPETDMLSEILDIKRASHCLQEAIGLIGQQVKLVTACGLGQVGECVSEWVGGWVGEKEFYLYDIFCYMSYHILYHKPYQQPSSTFDHTSICTFLNYPISTPYQHTSTTPYQQYSHHLLVRWPIMKVSTMTMSMNIPCHKGTVDTTTTTPHTHRRYPG